MGSAVARFLIGCAIGVALLFIIALASGLLFTFAMLVSYVTGITNGSAIGAISAALIIVIGCGLFNTNLGR